MGDTNKKYDLPNSTMSLGDHLEELRMRMIRALLGLGIGLVICLVLGRFIIDFIEGPYNDATAEFLFSAKLDFRSDLASGAMSDHFRQEFKDKGYSVSEKAGIKKKSFLRKRNKWLIIDGNNRYWVKEGEKELKVYKLDRLIVIAVAAGFVSYVKIALISGLILSSPWVFYQLWMFVAAGLYPHEKRYVYYAVPFSVVLFVCGALFFIMIVAPLTVGFLVRFNERILDVRSQFTLQHYVAFVSQLMLVFGLAFQTPTAIFFLNRTGLVSVQALNRSRKFVVLAIFIVAAMATPPDWISQVTLAIPLYFLFEIGVLLSYLSSRRRKSQNND